MMTTSDERAAPAAPLYAWRVLDLAGEPTSIVVTLDDSADSQTAALVIAAARRQGIDLQPVYPPDLGEPAAA